MSEQTFETFDALYKTVHRQGRRIEELENRVVELERRLASSHGELLEDIGHTVTVIEGESLVIDLRDFASRPLLSMDSARRCERIGKGEE